MEKDKVVLLIPAFNPDQRLVQLIYELKSDHYNNIIVINDGSDKECDKYFNEIKSMVNVLTHAVNLGKRKSFKNGIYYFLNNYKNALGIITLDSDGQHTVYDVEKIYTKNDRTARQTYNRCKRFRYRKCTI